jgi:hypothetical protein
MDENRQGSITNDKFLRFTEQELFISDGILVPATEEDGFQSIYYALFLRQMIDRIWPKLRDELNDGISSVDDASVRTIIDSQLKSSSCG